MKKYQRLMYNRPLAEPVYAEIASILCQSDQNEDLTFDSNINYNNPFGNSEGTID